MAAKVPAVIFFFGLGLVRSLGHWKHDLGRDYCGSHGTPFSFWPSDLFLPHGLLLDAFCHDFLTRAEAMQVLCP